jgi:hypothetical protein
MRSTQYVGLTEEVQNFLKENAQTKENKFNNGYGDCITTMPITKKIGTCGMFDELDLLKY